MMNQLSLWTDGIQGIAAGIPVVTDRGVLFIEDVKVGDRVLTHKRRWKKVTNIEIGLADTVKLVGLGSCGIECTENTKFLTREKIYNSKRCVSGVTDSHWVNASESLTKFWFNPTDDIESLPIPDIPNIEKRYPDFTMSDDFMYFIGLWLGDGWLWFNKHSYTVGVCCEKGEQDEMLESLNLTGLKWSMKETPTGFNFCAYFIYLCKWMQNNFGKGAFGKTLPGWVYGMGHESRNRLLQGYFDTDGYFNPKRNRYELSSISRRLLVGTKVLAGSLRYFASFTKPVMPHDSYIKGGWYHSKMRYIIQFYNNSNSSFFKDGGWWGKVKKILPEKENQLVYSLEVEDDHSFTVDGVAVHDCTETEVLF